MFHAGTAHGVSPFRALLLSCSRTLSPAPYTLLSLVRLPSCPTRSSCRRNQPRIKRRKRSASHTDKETATSLGYRVLLHTRVRHGQRRFRPMRARGSLGLLPLQGVHPRMGGLIFVRTSPHVVSGWWARRTTTRPTSGAQSHTRLAGLSRDCRPSWGFLPRDNSQRSTRTRPGSYLLGHRGSSPSPGATSQGHLTSSTGATVSICR